MYVSSKIVLMFCEYNIPLWSMIQSVAAMQYGIDEEGEEEGQRIQLKVIWREIIIIIIIIEICLK